MDSHRENLETHDSPGGSLKCSDSWGDVSLGWSVLSSPQIRTGSNSPAGKSCRRVPEVYWPVPLESCQEGRQQREGQRRNAAGDLSRACLSRCLDSHGAEPYNYNHRQLSATCLYPHSPAVPITTAAAEVRGEKILPLKPKADKLGVPAHTPLTSFYRLLFSQMQK